MKKSVLKFLLFAFLFISCSVEQPNEVEKFYSINGEIQEFIDGQVNYIPNIVVDLLHHNLISDTSDSQGNFNFVNLPEDQYQISIKDSLFTEFDTTIYLKENMNLEVILARQLEDYFPLKLNNSWKFHYTYQIHDNAYCVGVAYKKYEGIKNWEVTNIQADSLYEITETINAVELDPIFDKIGCVISYDTIAIIQYQSIFYLIQHSNNQLISQEPADLFHGAKIFRFQQTTAADTLAFAGFINGGTPQERFEIAKIVKDVGLISYYYHIGPSSHHFDFETLELLKAILN